MAKKGGGRVEEWGRGGEGGGGGNKLQNNEATECHKNSVAKVPGSGLHIHTSPPSSLKEIKNKSLES